MKADARRRYERKISCLRKSEVEYIRFLLLPFCALYRISAQCGDVGSIIDAAFLLSYGVLKETSLLRRIV